MARWWRRPRAIRWISSLPTKSASRWRCARGCRVLRRAGRLLRLRRRALHREEAGRFLPARYAQLPRHPAAAVRGGGGDRQPVGQAVPDRLCQPRRERGLYARQEAAAAVEGSAALLGQRAADQGRREPPGPAQLCQGRLPGGRGEGQGADRRGRLHAGAGGPAHPQALHGQPLEPVPRAAIAQSQPLHVLLPPGRFPCGGRQPRDPGAPGEHGRGPEGHHPPAGRHAPARRHARGRQGHRKELVADPKNAPSM